MGPRAHQLRAAATIVLLLSLHVHHVAASRVHPVKSVLRDDARGGSKAQADHEQSLLQAMEEDGLESGVSSTGWCTYFSSKTFRLYHFDLLQDDGSSIALELVRSPLAPRLKIYPGHSWSVRPTGDPDWPLEWEPLPVANASAAPASEIDFLKDVEYIERVAVPDAPDGIIIKKRDGSNATFLGGLYYPDQIVATVLKPAENWDENPVHNTYNISAVTHGLGHAGSGFKSGFVGTNGALLGFGFVLGAEALLGSLTVAGTTVAVNGVAVTGVSTMSMLMYSAGSGAAFGAGAALLGLGVGLAVGVAVGVFKGVRHLVKANRELKLTASEKLYEKLQCHKKMQQCGSGDESKLVPKWASCSSVYK